ncbi:N-acetylglucosamine kinase [Desertivirga arenae]|uniref:N-acetylglucosamine kinase n=1 Tax=Desertivirga arenae TaxID=2810309 RepID=UPI001A96AAB7|nr:N-acetylglucosamine kinase [Pedobacter sp. SYSU D00823]
MIIIADGGSTKTNWCLLNKENKKVYFNTEGYNPYFVTKEYIVESLKKNLPADLDLPAVAEVNFYGAGVHNEEKANEIKEAFAQVFTHSKIFVGHDLLAAARALLGDKPGFAAILGTGTNTCIYDGKEIVEQIDSGAYILGDEGSGCHIGKKLLIDYLRGYMPQSVRDSFWNTFQLTPDDIQENVYSKPLASRFCASFAKFVYEETSDRTYTRGIVKQAFTDFFKNLVSHYPNYQNFSFNCIGSVAYSFRDILEEVAGEYGMQMGELVRSPIDNLVEYHVEHRG